MIPQVNISIANGQLGRTLQTEDGVVGMVLTAASGSSLVGTPFLFTSLADAIADGITLVAEPFAYKQINEFYSEAGTGAKLYVLLYPETVTMKEVLDTGGTYTAAPLLEFANGAITLLGIARKVTAETSIPGNFLFKDVIDAIDTSPAFINYYRDTYKPFRVLLQGRIDVEAATPQQLSLKTNNAVAVVLGDTESGISAAVGLALGRLAKIPVQRNIGRVKDGALPITDAYIAATKVEQVALLENYIGYGYITLRTYVGRSGYYFSDDPMCVATTDDYAILTNGRVIDKAYRIAYQVYLNELNAEVLVDDAGKINASVAKYLEGMIEGQINALMAGEISAFDAFVDPNQNVIADSSVNVEMNITPVGYSKIINIQLGFVNPFNN